MTSSKDFELLECSAFEVIHTLQTFPQFANAKLCIIGGMAVCKYMPRLRKTPDIDIMVTPGGAPSAMKQILRVIPESLFHDRPSVFSYKQADGKLVRIDIMVEIEFPYVPAAARIVRTIQADELPYISELDLIAFKIFSAGLRDTVGEKEKDASDAEMLLLELTRNGPVTLTEAQRKTILNGLDDVVDVGRRSRVWWETHLGL